MILLDQEHKGKNVQERKKKVKLESDHNATQRMLNIL